MSMPVRGEPARTTCSTATLSGAVARSVTSTSVGTELTSNVPSVAVGTESERTPLANTQTSAPESGARVAASVTRPRIDPMAGVAVAFGATLTLVSGVGGGVVAGGKLASVGSAGPSAMGVAGGRTDRDSPAGPRNPRYPATAPTIARSTN